MLNFSVLVLAGRRDMSVAEDYPVAAIADSLSLFHPPNTNVQGK